MEIYNYYTKKQGSCFLFARQAWSLYLITLYKKNVWDKKDFWYNVINIVKKKRERMANIIDGVLLEQKSQAAHEKRTKTRCA